MRQNSSSDDLPRLVSCPLHYKCYPASGPEVMVIFFHNWFPFHGCLGQVWVRNGNVTQCSASSLELLSTLLTRCGEQLWISSLFSFGQMRKDCTSLGKCVTATNRPPTHWQLKQMEVLSSPPSSALGDPGTPDLKQHHA